MIDSQCTSVLRRAARTLVVLSLLAAFAACTTTTPTRPLTDVRALEQRAQAAVEARNFAAASDLYTQLATGTSGATRAGYLLEAARLATEYGDTALARRRLAEARGGATPEQQQMITVLLARLELEEGRPQAALDALAPLPQQLADTPRIAAAEVRGRALFELGRPVDAVRVLAEREVWLNDADSILANQRLIWDGFRRHAPAAPLPAVGDSIVDGWLALAPLVGIDNGSELRRALLTWRQTYTDHPAAAGLLAELLASQRSANFPSSIALLLPLSSEQRRAALAIRDGFLAAHLRNAQGASTTVRIYDTTRVGSQEAYLRAQLEGAEFIVGPLLRPEVDQVIDQAGFVPTLALNFATKDARFLNGFYQYALAPGDEARAIAAAAATSGAKTALVFVPSNQRGYQIRDDFRAAFEAYGGEVLDWSGYEPTLQDFSQPTAAILNVARSTQRERRLAANLGVPIQFEPRRRQDADMIFVVADARAARLLAAQLRFYAAGDIPTYATSEIFDPGAPGRDNDLNGLIFVDAPSLIDPDAGATDLHRELTAFWPQRYGEFRLYGMGFDAYQLVNALYSGNGGFWPMHGLSGDLSLDEQGRVHRALPLAQFRNGRPVALETSPRSAGEPASLIGQR